MNSYKVVVVVTNKQTNEYKNIVLQELYFLGTMCQPSVYSFVRSFVLCGATPAVMTTNTTIVLSQFSQSTTANHNYILYIHTVHTYIRIDYVPTAPRDRSHKRKKNNNEIILNLRVLLLGCGVLLHFQLRFQSVFTTNTTQ